MKKILVFLVILFSAIFIWSLVDTDTPVISPKSDAKQIVEKNPFQSKDLSGHDVILQSPKDENVLTSLGHEAPFASKTRPFITAAAAAKTIGRCPAE